MVIEETIRNKMLDLLPDVPVYLEMPPTVNNPGSNLNFLLIEKTGSSCTNRIYTSTFAFQFYGETFRKAAELNERVKELIDGLLELDEITGVHFLTDYPFNNLARHQYRYQAVYTISHF